MIFISNTFQKLHEIKEQFTSFEIVHIDCIDYKKTIYNELIEAVYSSNYYFHKKKVYIFTSSDILTQPLLKKLFNLYYKQHDPKDIILLNIGTENEQFLSKEYKYKFKYLSGGKSKQTNDFFSNLKKIICLSKNRTKLLDYDEMDIKIRYILHVISYNLYKNPELNTNSSNLAILTNLNKYLHKIDKNTIHIMLNMCYLPLFLRRIDFPPKQKQLLNIEKKQTSKLTSNEIEKIASNEFLEEIEKKSTKSIRIKNSMF